MEGQKKQGIAGGLKPELQIIAWSLSGIETGSLFDLPRKLRKSGAMTRKCNVLQELRFLIS
jgi:hypothetical protein